MERPLALTSNDNDLHPVRAALGKQSPKHAHEVFGMIELLVQRPEALLDVEGLADGIVVL